MHCNLKAARCRTSPYISFNYDAHAKLSRSVYIRCRHSIFTADTLYVMLWPWPLTLNICSTLAVHMPSSNSVPNSSEIEQSAAELLRFEYLTLWPWTCISRVALCSGYCTKFKLSQAIRSRNVTIFRLMRYVTLWPWLLTPWPWTFVVDRDRVSRDETLMYEIWAKSNNPRLIYWPFSKSLHIFTPSCKKYGSGRRNIRLYVSRSA